MNTENLKLLRELRTQEKAIKAQIDIVKPLAIEEAKNLAPEDGGKFSIDGVGGLPSLQRGGSQAMAFRQTRTTRSPHHGIVLHRLYAHPDEQLHQTLPRHQGTGLHRLFSQMRRPRLIREKEKVTKRKPFG